MRKMMLDNRQKRCVRERERKKDENKRKAKRKKWKTKNLKNRKPYKRKCLLKVIHNERKQARKKETSKQ